MSLAGVTSVNKVKKRDSIYWKGIFKRTQRKKSISEVYPINQFSKKKITNDR